MMSFSVHRVAFRSRNGLLQDLSGLCTVIHQCPELHCLFPSKKLNDWKGGLVSLGGGGAIKSHFASTLFPL